MSILKHRADIDRLRALAIISNVLKYVGFGLFRGVYIGILLK